MTADRPRCAWAATNASVAYHDEEWGVPVHDDRRLFEMLVLEGAQAGLSWETILGKRAGYRRAFAGFDPAAVAKFDRRRIDRLVEDSGIVRHRGKIESAVVNARALLAVREERGPFAVWVWSLVGGRPRDGGRRRSGELPASTPESAALSRELKRRGFRFVGPTTCYAFMQAVGMVNDHTMDCFRHAEIAALAGDS
ncbi:MAG TPA: DNA-3-methyladenine glycosylase I [Gemmatimonadota bacterium]|nr:DNA-3-methyladenine glycosylase I [Gemmatimonadota bacterium]